MIAADHRRRELAQIHIAKAQLGLEDDEYRALLWTAGRVRSAADLDFAGRQRVLEQLKARGFRPTARRARAPEAGEKDAAWGWVNKAPADRQPMLRKINVLLRGAGCEKSYADGIAKRMFGVDLVEFCAPDQLHRIVSALEFYRRRRSPDR